VGCNFLNQPLNSALSVLLTDLRQYAGRLDLKAQCYAQLAVFSPAVDERIAIAPIRGWMARLSGPEWPPSPSPWNPDIHTDGNPSPFISFKNQVGLQSQKTNEHDNQAHNMLSQLPAVKDRKVKQQYNWKKIT